MCLAVPAKVISIEHPKEQDDGPVGVIEMGGVKRDVGLQLVPEVKIGDYVLVHAGYAIQILQEEDAKASLALLEEMLSHEEAFAEEKTE